MKAILTFLFAGLLAADQITKYAVRASFDLYESVPVVDGLFNLTYVLNPGAAFGMFAQMGETARSAFFYTVTIIAIIAVAYLLFHEGHHKLRAYGYTLILSGAVGNFIDRIFIGKVVDFLDFYIASYHWPAFNVADSCISVGVFLILLDIVFTKRGIHS